MEAEKPGLSPPILPAGGVGTQSERAIGRGAALFIYFGLIVWLAGLLAEVYLPARPPSYSATLFAAVALSWTRFVRDNEERRRARILTLLLFLVLGIYQFVPLLIPLGLWGVGSERAWAVDILGIGLLCMWFGAVGLTIFAESLGRIESSDTESAPARPRIGYWLLALYLIGATLDLWRELLRHLLRVIAGI